MTYLYILYYRCKAGIIFRRRYPGRYVRSVRLLCRILALTRRRKTDIRATHGAPMDSFEFMFISRCLCRIAEEGESKAVRPSVLQGIYTDTLTEWEDRT